MKSISRQEIYEKAKGGTIAELVGGFALLIPKKTVSKRESESMQAT